jgi:hypothetical protein
MSGRSRGALSDSKSQAMVEKFISSCSFQRDRKHPGKPDDMKPIISSTFNSRGQLVDLINMTTYPDGNMKWILYYQDHHDKMSSLHVIPKEGKTVALGLLQLFLMQGTPIILQSDNGHKFVAKV